jgi:hypothetical protein
MSDSIVRLVSATGYQLFWDDYSDRLPNPSELIPVRKPSAKQAASRRPYMLGCCTCLTIVIHSWRGAGDFDPAG